MDSVFLLTLAAVGMSLVATPIVRKISLRFGAVDLPDKQRKLHSKPTARLGGVAVWSALASVCAIVIGNHAVSSDVTQRFVALLASASIVFLVGLADDLRNLKPSSRLVAEIIASLLFWWFVVHGTYVGTPTIAHWWGAAAAVLWIVACTNAFNLIDGVDGLAAGLAFIGASAVTIAALLRGDLTLAMISGPLAGALLGFLVYNFHPASIFLGDSGSLLIGFLLGCCTVLWAQRYHTYLGASGPFMTLSIPLLDTGLAVLRRFLRRRPIFSGDRGHIHHRLLDRGLSPSQVALVLYLAGGIAGTVALLHQQLRQPYADLIVIVLGSVELSVMRFLRYTEIPAMAHFILKGVLRCLVNVHIELWTFERTLSAARTLGECRAVIRDGGHAFGISWLRIHIHGEVWEERLREGSQEACWRIHVPIAGSDYMDLVHTRPPGGLNMIGCFVEVVCRELQAKLLAQYAEPTRWSWSADPTPELAKTGAEP